MDAAIQIATLGSGGGVLTKAGYLAFGENPSVVSGTFRYTGRPFDAETAGSAAQPSGLYYYRARMYSPTLGRFLQADPIGYAGGGNLYAYVHNDPLNFTDPLGLCDNPQGCGGGGQINNLTAGDILSSYAAGAGNALAQGGVNLLYGLGQVISMGDLGRMTGGAPQVQPFTPTSNYFASEGAATAQGVTAVAGAAGLGKALAGGTAAAASDSEYILTQTVQNNLATRPYINSLTIREIVSTGKGVPDPGGIPGALRYDVSGSFNGSQGTYQLVIHPQTNTVYYMLFTSGQ